MNIRTLLWYVAALLMFCVGGFFAADSFPNGYDWPFRSVSSLASRKHNPEGGAYFSSAISLSMILLWPCIVALKHASLDARHLRHSMRSLQLGLIVSVVVGLDRLILYDMSAIIPQSHELLAVIAFISLASGVFGLLHHQVFHLKSHLLIAVLIVLGALAMAGVLLWISAGGPAFENMNSPSLKVVGSVLISPPFWQWLFVVLLWLGFGLLLLPRSASKARALDGERH